VSQPRRLPSRHAAIIAAVAVLVVVLAVVLQPLFVGLAEFGRGVGDAFSDGFNSTQR
jgi:hypothetical protein